MRTSLAVTLLAMLLGAPGAILAQNAALRVGAAKVDITPAADALPRNYLGILDHIHLRAIVIDNGTTTAALITVDAGSKAL